MHARRQVARWLLTLVCVIVLGARVDGSHLHLCLDGQESAASVRMGPDAAESGVNAPHNDVDVALSADLLTKSAKGDLKAPPALPSTPPLSLILVAGFAPPALALDAFVVPSAVRLPPSCGPPASTTA